MKIKPLRCPFCGAPIKIAHDRYLKCDFCRGRFIVENSNEEVEVKPQEIRTPKECWRLMGFSDEDFKKAKGAGISNSQLYKQAGNSIVVNVLEDILRNQ